MVEKALNYAKQHEEQFLEDLRYLVRQPSIAAQDKGVKETAEMVKKMMEDVGVQADIVPVEGGQPVVYGHLDAGRSRTLLFYDHYDVQPPEPLDEWSHPPFGGEVHDGSLYARGVSDNKGNIVARLKAIEAFIKTAGTVPVNIKFVIEGEEEIGSVNFHKFVEAERARLASDAVIWESGSRDVSGRPTITFGNKGICYIQLDCRGANQDLHSSRAAIVENPAWRLVQALATMKDLETDRCLVGGFYDDVLPPTAREIEMMEKNPVDEKETLAQLGLRGFLLELTGIELSKKLLYQPTCTICGLWSGYTGQGTKTVMPKEAHAKIDHRLVPNQTALDIFEKVKRHLAKHGFADIQIQLLSHEDPGQSSLDAPIVPVILETARTTYGVEPVVNPRSAGSGPMYLFNRLLGIATISGVGVGYYKSGAHAPDEHIRLEDYHKGIEHVIRIMAEFGKA
ncbi:MAG: M20/M25/M40 family metallo-hydrolase [Bacillota bacterium]|nr:M20/M25/M40 family metallo-hydrolase [Bacillota bacterium]